MVAREAWLLEKEEHRTSGIERSSVPRLQAHITDYVAAERMVVA
jgi:hypothetical protein